VNQDLHAASLRLLVEPWKDRCFTATVKGYSQLVNQDLHAASLQLWVEPWKDRCLLRPWKDSTHGSNQQLQGRCNTHDVKTCQTCLLNLSVRLLWDVLWLSESDSFAKRETCCAYRECCACQSTTSRTLSNLSVKLVCYCFCEAALRCSLVIVEVESDGFFKRGASYTHRECCACQRTTSRTLNWWSCWLCSFWLGFAD
jgi:hypothetical protein